MPAKLRQASLFWLKGRNPWLCCRNLYLALEELTIKQLERGKKLHPPTRNRIIVRKGADVDALKVIAHYTGHLKITSHLLLWLCLKRRQISNHATNAKRYFCTLSQQKIVRFYFHSSSIKKQTLTAKIKELDSISLCNCPRLWEDCSYWT